MANIHIPKQSVLNGAAFMGVIGIHDTTVTKLADAGWVVKLTASKFTISKDALEYYLPIDATTLESLQGGGNWAVPGLKSKVYDLIKTAIGDPDQSKFNVFFKHLDLALAGKKTELIKEYRKEFGVSLKEAKDAVEDWLAANPQWIPPNVKSTSVDELVPKNPAKPVETVKVLSTEAWPLFPLKEMQTAATCKLRDATKMYQPVRGTSASSRYFLVAANQDVRVACRYTPPADMRVRIEGPGWKKHLSRIKDVGFDTIHEDKDYASIGLSVANEVLAGKALGAVLVGLGLPFETPFPILGLIKGKGS